MAIIPKSSAYFGPLGWYCQKVLPLVYDESLSYYEAICKLADIVQKMAVELDTYKARMDRLELRQDALELNFQNLKTDVEGQLRDQWILLNQIKNGDYVDLYLDSIKNWIDQNLQNLVRDIVKYVSFGISDDGYFVAYIPATWDFINFDTVPYGEKDEGHLITEW